MLSQALHYLGELEAVFIIWTVPLFWSIVYLRGWHDAIFYVSSSELYRADVCGHHYDYGIDSTDFKLR